MEREITRFQLGYFKCLMGLDRIKYLYYPYNAIKYFPVFCNDYLLKEYDFTQLANGFEDMVVEMVEFQNAIIEWLAKKESSLSKLDTDPFTNGQWRGIHDLYEKVQEKTVVVPPIAKKRKDCTNMALMLKQYDVGWKLVDTALYRASLIYLDYKWASNCPKFCKEYEEKRKVMAMLENRFRNEVTKLAQFQNDLADWIIFHAKICMDDDETKREEWEKILQIFERKERIKEE